MREFFLLPVALVAGAVILALAIPAIIVFGAVLIHGEIVGIVRLGGWNRGE